MENCLWGLDTNDKKYIQIYLSVPKGDMFCWKVFPSMCTVLRNVARPEIPFRRMNVQYSRLNFSQECVFMLAGCSKTDGFMRAGDEPMSQGSVGSMGADLNDSILLFSEWVPTITHYSITVVFSSAVPSGSGAFQMPTCPSSSASSAASSASSAASTLRGGRANLRNASVTFSIFWHEASLGWH